MTKEPSALIFNVVHGSFVDGPGIRTTVFLKGCPLRCKWCCNPEGQDYRNQLRVVAANCTGCGRCVDACPRGALSVQDGLVRLNREACDCCGLCETACWYGALSRWGKPYTLSQLAEELLRDKPYYERSGGGVTIGGGEASSFPEFCLPLIDLLHREGIHVAVDTCGYAVTEEQKEVLRRADLLLFDLKGLSEARHLENTGVSNAPVLENFRAMREMEKPVIVRVPLIPGHNDSGEELSALVELLKSSPNAERVDVMFYHEFGCFKYSELGREYPLDRVKPYSDAEQERILSQLRACGHPVQIGG